MINPLHPLQTEQDEKIFAYLMAYLEANGYANDFPRFVQTAIEHNAEVGIVLQEGQTFEQHLRGMIYAAIALHDEQGELADSYVIEDLSDLAHAVATLCSPEHAEEIRENMEIAEARHMQEHMQALRKVVQAAISDDDEEDPIKVHMVIRSRNPMQA